MQFSRNKDGKTTKTRRHGGHTENALCDLRASVSPWFILVLNLESFMALDATAKFLTQRFCCLPCAVDMVNN